MNANVDVRNLSSMELWERAQLSLAGGVSHDGASYHHIPPISAAPGARGNGTSRDANTSTTQWEAPQ